MSIKNKKATAQASRQYEYNPRGFMEEVPNLSYVIGLVGDDFGFRRKFLAIIKEEFPSERRQYLLHMKQKEPRAASEWVHKLKYRISALGMEWAFDLADKYERRLQSGDCSLEIEFKRILNKITRFLETV